MPRLETVSGWDVARRQPKPALRAAPAGSVYWLDDFQGDPAAIGEQDALTIRANAARQAWGYKVEANNYRNEGRVAKATGRNAAAGTYLTTAANAMSQGASMARNRKSSLTTTG